MRRRRPERRQILPDPVYNDKLVAKFVNYIMDRGKKGIAEKIFYGAMNQIKQRTKTDGLKIFEVRLKFLGIQRSWLKKISAARGM